MDLSSLFNFLGDLAPAGRVDSVDVAPSGAPFAYLDTWSGRPRETRVIQRLAASAPAGWRPADRGAPLPP